MNIKNEKNPLKKGIIYLLVHLFYYAPKFVA